MPAPLLSSWLEFLHLQNINREERREGVEYVCTTCGCCGGSTFKIYNPGNMGPSVGGCTASA